jgi:hypothetical protein
VYSITNSAGSDVAVIKNTSGVDVGNVTVTNAAGDATIAVSLAEGVASSGFLTYTGSTTATVAESITAGAGGSNTTLTSNGTNVDSITGGAGADIVAITASASIGSAKAITKLGAGTDSVTITLAGTDTLTLAGNGANFTGVETFTTKGASTGTVDIGNTTALVDADLVAGMVFDIQQASVSTTITLGAGVTLAHTVRVIQDGSDVLTFVGSTGTSATTMFVKLAAAVYDGDDLAVDLGAGTGDVLNLDINGLAVTSIAATIDGDLDGVDTLNIINTTAATGSMGAFTLNEAGASALATIDASTISNAVTIGFGDNAGVSGALAYKGSTGVDTITTATAGTSVIQTITLNGGLDVITLLSIAAADRVLLTGFDATGAGADVIKYADALTTVVATTNATFQVVSANPGGTLTFNTAASEVLELAYNFATVGDISTATNGGALLAGLGGVLSVAATTNKGYVIAYQGGNAYLYYVVEGADGDAAVAAGDIALIGVFNGVAVGDLSTANFVGI